MVRRRLASGVLPYLILCRQLKRLWLYRIHKFYSWTRDILAAAVGTGLVPPIFGRVLDTLEDKSGAADVLRASLVSLPTWLMVMGVAAFVALAALKLVVFKV